MAAKPQPVKVLYCPACSLPAEYCEFGPDFEKCKPWLLKNAPDLYPDLLKGTKPFNHFPIWFLWPHTFLHDDLCLWQWISLVFLIYHIFFLLYIEYYFGSFMFRGKWKGNWEGFWPAPIDWDLFRCWWGSFFCSIR